MLDRTSLEIHNELLEAASRLKPLPSSVMKLVQLIGEEDSDIDEITRVVRNDLGLVTALLRAANSAASAARDAIGSVEVAIVRLGLARVLATAVADALDKELSLPLPAYGLADGMLAEHAIATSHIAELVANECPRRIGPEVVTAALLHDIGCIVLDGRLEPNLFAIARTHHPDLAAAERELADLDHAELGALLAQQWKLPEAVVQAIAHHHDPVAVGSDLAHVVAVSDALAHELMIDRGLEVEAIDEVALVESLEILGLERDDITSKAVGRLERLGLIDDLRSP